MVLAEFSSTSTNANAVARQILEQMMKKDGININDSNASYSHDRFIFHVKRNDGLTVLCMADEASGRKQPFLLLFRVGFQILLLLLESHQLLL